MVYGQRDNFTGNSFFNDDDFISIPRQRKRNSNKRRVRSTRRMSKRHTRKSRKVIRRSKGGIKYTKNGQPYRIMANGRARFIKGRRKK